MYILKISLLRKDRMMRYGAFVIVGSSCNNLERGDWNHPCAHDLAHSFDKIDPCINFDITSPLSFWNWWNLVRSRRCGTMVRYSTCWWIWRIWNRESNPLACYRRCGLACGWQRFVIDLVIFPIHNQLEYRGLGLDRQLRDAIFKKKNHSR